MIFRLFAVLAALFLSAAAWADTLVVNSPGDGFLNLRTGPGSKYQVIMRMPHRSHVETLEIAGNWARVRHETGNVGWAFRKYMVSPEPGPVRYRVVSPNDGFLNLRTGPGTRYDIITPMYNGTRVTILESAGAWVRVRTDLGQEGWAFAKYLLR